jgi:small subunit ribosomal protein S7e
MAFTARAKIKKPRGAAAPTQFEESIAQLLFDLQTHATSTELKSELKSLQISAAKEVTFGDGKKAVVLFVPPPQLRDYRRIHNTLVDDLQKKLSGKHVLIVAQRRILPVEKKGQVNRFRRQKRPYSRTLTAVHDALLDDVAFPAEIIDRRIRVRLDGSKAQRVTLDPKEADSLDHKLETFSGVYKVLTGKDVTFQFQVSKDQ